MRIAHIKITLATFLLATSSLFALAVVSPSPVRADFQDNLCGGADLSLTSKSDCSGKCLEHETADKTSPCTKFETTAAESSINRIVKLVVNILTTIIGLLAVIFIIIGGFKFVTSGGDSGKVSSAKNTIIYALIGLIIVAFAQILVRFVLSKAT